MSKLSNVVDNDVLKKFVYDKLVIKVNAIDTKIPSTIGLITKAHYDSDKHGLQKNIDDVDKKIPNTSGLKHKNTKIENKIPSVTGLVTTAAVNTKAPKVECKVSEITDLELRLL